jgi:hypothetical protein
LEGSVSAHYASAYRDDRFVPVRKIGSFTTLDASLAFDS